MSTMFGCKKNQKETKEMPPNFSQQLKASPKVKATPEKVRKPSELLGMDFSDFDKYKTCTNSKDIIKVTSTSV